MKQRCFKLRQQNTIFLFQLRHLLYTGRIKYELAESLLRPFHLYMEQINALPIVDVLHVLHSTEGNEVTKYFIDFFLLLCVFLLNFNA